MNNTIPIFLLILFSASTSFGQCDPTATENLSINNVNAGLLNGGDMFRDFDYNAMYEVPKGSGTNAIFTAATWMGGVDDQGTLRVAAQTYRQTGTDFYPGPINEGETTEESCVDFDRFWKITGADIEAFKLVYEENVLEGGETSLEDIPQSLLEWPAKNNPYFMDYFGSELPQDKDLAPFWDADQDGNYDPLNGDYPVINSDIEGQFADEMVWWIYNDIGGPHGSTGGEAMGMEISVLAYAFQSDDFLNDATFYRYKLNYQGTETLNDFYFGYWVDADLGNYQDDYIGCDTTQNMGYVYNGDASDEGSGGYGDDPPILGVKVMEGLLNDTGEETVLSSFLTYNNDNSATGNPNTPEGYYNYLKSTWLDDTPLTEGGNGYGGNTATNYMYAGNPGSEGWSECSENNAPADRRFILSTGPVKIEPGFQKFTTLGILFLPQGEAVYPCPDVTPLVDVAEQSEDFFEEIQESIVFEIPIDTMEIDSSDTSIESLYLNSFVNVFPNPMTDKAVIDISKLTMEVKEFALYDYTGKQVAYQKVTNAPQILVQRNGLSNGVYYYQIKGKQNVLANGKLVLQ